MILTYAQRYQRRLLEDESSSEYDKSLTPETAAAEEELEELSLPAFTSETNESTEMSTATSSRIAETMRNLKLARSSRIGTSFFVGFSFVLTYLHFNRIRKGARAHACEERAALRSPH